MTKKQKYIAAFLDGYFSDKNIKYGLKFFKEIEKATKLANKKYKDYEIHRTTKSFIKKK